MMRVDIAIIGGGIAGLSCAAALGTEASVAILEAESTLGYHATGRSAALYTECYGSEVIRRLAKASKGYYTQSHPELGAVRGLIFPAPVGDTDVLEWLASEYTPLVPSFVRITPREVEEACPLLPANMTAGGMYEPGALDLDVDGLQTSFVRTSRNNGVTILQDAPVTSIVRNAGAWVLTSGDTRVECETVVNAAGAWGDVVAGLAGVTPLGLSALARSVFTFDPGRNPSRWPMVVDARERWYIKPEGPHMLGSAASELSGEPRDARPDELDIATGIDRINRATTLDIRSVKNTWAGLRTFTEDRVPAVGRDGNDPGFFWLVGQGGYGIKTSPALGSLAAGLLLRDEVPPELSEFGVKREDLDPRRLRR
jgi:D-arginine dehydrogenase